jgi:GNAT superfamily N-acetyltransferase
MLKKNFQFYYVNIQTKLETNNMENSKIKIRRAKPEDKRAILNLLEKEYKRVFEQNQWDWRYERIRKGGDSVYWIVEVGKKIVGGRGAIPLRLQVSSEELTIGEIVDTIVDKDFRRKGIYDKLLQHSQKEFQLCQAAEMRGALSKPRPQAYRGLIKNNFNDIGQLVTWIKPLNITKVISKLIYTKLLKKNLDNDSKCIKNLENYNNYHWKTKNEKYQILLNPNVEDLSKIWNSRTSPLKIQVKKDFDRLQWRYLNSPMQYQFLIMKDSSEVPVGGIIFKRKKIRNMDVYEILDLAAKTKRYYTKMIRSFSTWAKKQDADLIRLIMYNYLSNRIMYLSGFLPISKNVHWLIKDWSIPFKIQKSFINNAENWRIIAGDIESF